VGFAENRARVIHESFVQLTLAKISIELDGGTGIVCILQCDQYVVNLDWNDIKTAVRTGIVICVAVELYISMAGCFVPAGMNSTFTYYERSRRLSL